MRHIWRISTMIGIIASLIITSCIILTGCGEEDDSFRVPPKSKTALVYSSGKGEKERSLVCFYDEQGSLLTKLEYDTVLCRNCIGRDPDTGSYHLFSHEKILFDDGTVLENGEMKDQYSFASDDGMDTVYESGYVDPWGRFYKSIPHGMSYEQADLGFFDLLTVYDKDQVANQVVEPAGSICVNEEEGAVYNFLDVDSEKELPYQKIMEKDGTFKISSGSVDMSSFPLLAGRIMETTVMYSVWDGRILYLIMDIVGKEESQKTDCIVRLEKNDHKIELADFKTFDLKKLSGEREAEMVMDGIVKDMGSTIQYYSYDSPCGVMMYDKKTGELSFTNFNIDLAERFSDEEPYIMLSEANNEVYLLAESSGDAACDVRRVLKDGNLEPIHTIHTDEGSGLFLTEFFVF